MMWQSILVLVVTWSYAAEISHIIEAKNATQIGTCNNEVRKRFPNCYCDSDCVVYGDCCITVQIPSSISSSLIPKQKCERFGNLGHPSFWTVNSCLGGKTAEDIVGRLPVIDRNGTVYINDLIAQCNNASPSSPMDIYVFLRFDICDTDLIYASLEKPLAILFMAILNSNCELMFYPKYDISVFPRVCIDWRERNLERNLSVKCKMYQNPVEISSVLYKNPQCYEDLHGNPVPENSTNIEDMFQQHRENVTSLHIEFRSSVRNYLSQENNLCKEEDEQNCHTRLIENWNQTLEVTLKAENLIHEYHILYSSMFFLYNFLKNDVNLTLASAVDVDTIARARRDSACHTLVITMPVKSTIHLSENDLKRTMSFVETFKMASFSSTIMMIDERVDQLSSYICKDNQDETKPRRRRRTYGLRYIVKMIEYFDIPDESYCQNLVVESTERLNRKYIDVRLTKWDCQQPNATAVDSSETTTPQYVYTMITVLSIVAFGVVVFGLYQIFSLNRTTNDSEE